MYFIIYYYFLVISMHICFVIFIQSHNCLMVMVIGFEIHFTFLVVMACKM